MSGHREGSREALGALSGNPPTRKTLMAFSYLKKKVRLGGLGGFCASLTQPSLLSLQVKSTHLLYAKEVRKTLPTLPKSLAAQFSR
jgi:hypothetical protein